MAIVNTNFQSLSGFNVTSNLTLVVNDNSTLSASDKSVPSYKKLLEEIVKLLPPNFYRGGIRSIVIFNNQFVKVMSGSSKSRVGDSFQKEVLQDQALEQAEPIPSKKVIYNYVIPFSSLNLATLDSVIIEIKTGGKK